MNLYLKYRPKTIEELDLASVRQAFGEMISANRVAHAYLMTGPRGAGKTSSARILARMVNCEHNLDKLGEPCNECPACTSILNASAVDVIEIDAASNRGIDDIRALKEKIRLAPALLRKKVYIIDEVHMLTSEAFNALLKTLEEPPNHALFVLCTTELHKVPGTIVSRCRQIQFGRATEAEMKRAFARVVGQEGKAVSEEALSYLAGSVDGSFRDGVKVLDLVLSGDKEVGIDEIKAVLGAATLDSVGVIMGALVDRDVQAGLRGVAEATSRGADLNHLLLNLMRGLRDKLIRGELDMNYAKLIFDLDRVAARSASSLDGTLLLQVLIVEWCGATPSENNQAPNTNNQTKTSNQTKNIEESKSVSKNQKPPEPKSSWMLMKEKFNSGDTIDEAVAIFTS